MNSIPNWVPIVIMVILTLGFLEGIYSVHFKKDGDTRKDAPRLYWITIVLVTTLCILASVFVGQVFHPVIGVISGLLLMAGFIGQGLAEIPADPPQIFVLTVFGAPVSVIVRAGWRFFPLRGLLFGGLSIDVKIVNEDIVIEDDTGLHGVTYRTHDDILGAAPLSFSYKPMASAKARLVENVDGILVLPIMNFIDAGKQEGIRDIMDDKAISAFQVFMSHVPTWRDSYELDNGGIADLVKAIAGGDGLDRIPSSVRTDHLLEFYKISKNGSLAKFPDAYKEDYPGDDVLTAIRKMIDADKVGEEHENAMRLIEERRECDESAVIPEEYEPFLQLLLKERKKQLEALKAGRANIEIPSLGIVLIKVNIGARTPDPNVVEAAAQLEIEKSQRKAEKEQSKARSEQAKNYTKMENFGGTGKDALELALIDAGKMSGKRETHVYDLHINETAAEALKDLAPAIKVIGEELLGRKGRGRRGGKSS